MIRVCPTCGSLTEGRKEVRVDLETNIAMVDGTPVKLTAKQAEFLWLIVDADPKTVSRDYAMARIYSQGADEPGNGIMGVMVCHIRTRLRAAGIRNCIDSVYGKGWRIK